MKFTHEEHAREMRESREKQDAVRRAIRLEKEHRRVRPFAPRRVKASNWRERRSEYLRERGVC